MDRGSKLSPEKGSGAAGSGSSAAMPGGRRRCVAEALRDLIAFSIFVPGCAV
jgi:hypothetical protein